MCQIKVMLYSQEIQHHTMEYKNTLKYVIYFMSNTTWCGAVEIDTMTIKVLLRLWY